MKAVKTGGKTGKGFTLLITEKPSAAKRIADALAEGEIDELKADGASYYRIRRKGRDIVVVSAAGHLFSLTQKEKSAVWSYPVFSVEWKPTWEASRTAGWSKKYYDAIMSLAKGAEDVISSCDFDIEGCTPYSERILAKDNGITRLTTMGELFDCIASTSGKKNWKNFDYSEPEHDIFVPCFDKEGLMLGFRKLKKVMRRPADPTILRMTTETGRNINVSKNHPMFVLEPDGLEMKNADSVKIGDYVPVAKDVSFIDHPLKEMDLIHEIEKRGRVSEYYVYGARNLVKLMPAEVASKLSVNRKTALSWRFWDRMPLQAYLKLERDMSDRRLLRIGPKKAKTKTPAFLQLDRDLGRLTGYYLAEGCTDTSGFIGMYFGPTEANYVNDVESILIRLIGSKPRKRFRSQVKGAFGTSPCWEIGTKSKILEFIFSDVMKIGVDAYSKRLPEIIFSSPIEFSKNVIDAYLAGDGSLFKSRDRWAISAASKSRELIEGLHALLLSMGINSNLVYDRKKDTAFIWIGVKGEIKKMIKYGIDTLVTKMNLREELLEKRNLDGKRDVFNMLPNFLLSGCSADTQTINNMRHSQRTSVSSLTELTPLVEAIKESNIHLLRIIKIEEIPNSSPYLYDVETETGSFMHGNGVITHNSVIAFNIIRFICKKSDGKRMRFSTLTRQDLIDAYDNASEHLDFPQIDAGLARHHLDFLWGINMSRALTLALQKAGGYKTLSTGRVQGPVLELLDKRQKEIDAFKPVPFWILQLDGKLNSGNITATHAHGEFWEKKEAEAALAKCKGGKAVVGSVESREYRQKPPFPFDLTTLQRDAYLHFHYSPKQTLDLAQSLYEQAVISYPRTSSQKLPDKLGFKAIINSLWKQPAYKSACEALLKKPSLKPNEGPKSDPAHPAIYPTGNAPRALKSYQKNIYDLITKRFLATFAGPAKRLAMKITIDVGGEKFSAEGATTLEPGWMDFYKPYARMKEEALPEAKKGDEVKPYKIEMLDKETQPPKRFTQASILKEMEKLGLGTKGTRALILQTLYDRGYIQDDSIAVTKLGQSVTMALDKYCPDIISVELTRRFENEMESIEEGKLKPAEVVAEAEGELKKILGKFKENEARIGGELLVVVRETAKAESTVGKCPACGGDLVMRNSKAGKRFVGCTGYPKCTQTYSLPQNGYIKKLSETCKNCGLNILSVKGRGRRPWKLCIKCGFVNFKKKEAGEETGTASAEPKAAKTAKPMKAAVKKRAPKKKTVAL